MNTGAVVALAIATVVAVPAVQTAKDSIEALTARVTALEARVALLEKGRPSQPSASAARWRTMTVNMTRAQVIATLGKPAQRVAIDCIVPPLMVGGLPTTGECDRWMMADGGVVEFKRADRDLQQQVVDRWKLPGTQSFVRQ